MNRPRSEVEPAGSEGWDGPSALIGFSGFVGGNLDAQTSFEDRFRSSNITDMRGRSYGWFACAGAPGVKWKANKEPDADREALRRLRAVVDTVRADRAVLISTVDVYPEPCDVDEATPIDPAAGHAYGRHRLELEDFFQDRFETLVVRLPGLFGPGLKKNIIFDFLHDNAVGHINPDSVFQFYDIRRLWADIQRAWNAGLRLVNFATEPVSVADVARWGFGFEFANRDPGPLARYDMHTRHAAVWDRSGDYIAEGSEVLAEIANYVTTEGWIRP